MLTERSIYDIEQFIEHFDARQLVRFPRRRLPKYLEVYMDAEVREGRLHDLFSISCLYRKKN